MGRRTTLVLGGTGISRALGRPPRDFTEYVRDTAATGLDKPSTKKSVPFGSPGRSEMGTLVALIEEIVKTGVPDATERGQPAPKGHRMRRPRRRVTITDGPFAETKELIAGAVC